jgi:hypothetical protein
MDLTVIGVSAPSAEGEAKPKSGSVGAALLERTEQLLNLARREATAFVLDLNEDALSTGGHS